LLIIVEGPPGAGKTSLTNKLRTALGHQYGRDAVTTLYGSQNVSTDTNNKNYLSAYLEPLEGYTPGSGQHVICDEWHWALPAVKNVFNKTDAILPFGTRYVDLKLAQLGAVIVHLNPSTEVLKDRLTRRNPFTMPPMRIYQKMKEIRAQYVEFSHDSATTVLPSTASLSTIVDTATHLERQASTFNQWSHTTWPFYLGSHTPRGVLIDLDPGQYDTCYPDPHSGESYLHRALGTLPVQHREELGMLNVAHVTAESFTALMTTLKAPRILALGRAPSQYLGAVAHVTVPSHRRMRRSFPTNITEYGALLRNALKMPNGTDLMKWNPSS
jgi:deoxyadenosine/deoxycytidine kinase